jgi:serine/threonine protein kinase
VGASSSTLSTLSKREERGAPECIGRYVIEGQLGEGGMGRVWLAHDTVLGRHVAIKVLRDDLALPAPVRDELFVRMRHEARAAAAVSHPHIVTLYDMGEDDSVGLYLVFEFVSTGKEGREVVSVRDRLREGRLSLDEVGKLAREIGDALTFAHDAGIVHRDIKPENILHARSGFKVADFGIARVPDSTLTHANLVLGTPAYTAPEALSTGTFSPATDQFSFAATLYEAVTGVRAFHSDDASVTAHKVTMEPPQALDPSIADEPRRRTIERALFRGMAKDEKDRFPTCAEFGRALAEAVAPSDVPVPRDTLPPRRSLRPVGSQLAAILDVDPAAVTPRVTISGRPEALSEPVRPSIIVRKQTRRFQNIAAGIALFVIAGLLVMGRRNRTAETASPARSSDGHLTVAPTVTASAPRVPVSKPKPATSARILAPDRADASPSVDPRTAPPEAP